MEYHNSRSCGATDREPKRFRRMPSSVIQSYRYDPERSALLIRFVSGHAYSYFDVPEEVAKGLTTARSKGRYFQEHIRDRFAFRRERSAA
jgi:lysyl-tRNA synthetase class 2